MRTRKEIESEIALTQAELQNVQGTATEVYARIVGYYRSVRNWNKGKREEFSERVMFSGDNAKIADYASAVPSSQVGGTVFSPTAFFTLYTRKTCPNCPPVAEYCSTLDIPVHYVDVDTEEGSVDALAHDVRSCPTLIAYDTTGQELTRAYSVSDLLTCRFLPAAAEAVIA